MEDRTIDTAIMQIGNMGDHVSDNKVKEYDPYYEWKHQSLNQNVSTPRGSVDNFDLKWPIAKIKLRQIKALYGMSCQCA